MIGNREPWVLVLEFASHNACRESLHVVENPCKSEGYSLSVIQGTTRYGALGIPVPALAVLLFMKAYVRQNIGHLNTLELPTLPNSPLYSSTTYNTLRLYERVYILHQAFETSFQRYVTLRKLKNLTLHACLVKF